MQLEVKWPNGLTLNTDTATTDEVALLNVMRNVLVLSMTYGVIIDNGVVTFVEKS